MKHHGARGGATLDAPHGAAHGAARLAAEEERLLACVHCGFCLSSCPTYTRLGNEGDSPRGRIVLMRAVAEGRLDPTDDSFRLHIDQCLGCRACEPVCPSGVQYGFLVERARAAGADTGAQRFTTRALLATYGSSALSQIAGFIGRTLRSGGFAAAVARVMPRSFGGARLGLAMLAATRPARLPRVPRLPHGSARERATGYDGSIVSAAITNPLRAVSATSSPDDESIPAGSNARSQADPHALEGNYPAGTSLPPQAVSTGRRVAMLDGCVQHSLFRHVNDASRVVIRAAGCSLLDATGQGCCGALHAHSGSLDHALRLAKNNIDAFLAVNPDVIVVNAAGCGAMMKEYGEQLAHDADYAEPAREFSSRVRDINEFLAETQFMPEQPVPLRVTYDAPCHLHHAQRIAHAPIDLLQQVPQLEFVPLPGSEECCGGAGIYGITHPEIGGRILKDKIDAIVATKADVVVTANPGCTMQIGAGLILRGSNIPVMHPVEIFARSVARPTNGRTSG